LSQKIAKYILPFATSAENRKELFTKEIEKAAIFCLAELERGKGGGLIVKQPEEKLAFIAEVCYPFWLANLDDTRLLFDGLNMNSHTITYPLIPDVQGFTENLNKTSKTRQAYMDFLTDHTSYFQLSNNEEKKVIDGLITDPEFLQEFNSYVSEATTVKTPLSDMVVVSPTLDENTITSTIGKLKELKTRFTREINALYTSMKVLNKKTESFVKAIKEEIKETEEKFDREIEKLKAVINGKVDEIRREYDENLTEVSKNFEEELLDLQQEKIKLEKIKEQLNSEIEHCEAEIKTCAVNKDDVGERKWREEKDGLKKELSQTEAKIRELERKIKKVEEDKSLKIFKLKSERNAKIKEASKDLVDIEASRDAKIKIYQNEMEKLEELTSSIIKQIDKLAKMREASVAEFDKLGIKKKGTKNALVYMPFYMACYQSDSGKRYVPFPPSFANSVSFSVKFKGALGKVKIKHLLQPRSKKMVSLLNKFPALMEQNAVFKREMDEACVKANILRTESMLESVRIGLERLKEEGWFSDKEYEAFNKLLT